MKIKQFHLNYKCLPIYVIMLFVSCTSFGNSNRQTPEGIYYDSSITLIVKNNSNNKVQLSYINRFNEDEMLYGGIGNDTLRIQNVHFIPLKIKYLEANIMHPLMPSDTLIINVDELQKLSLKRLTKAIKEFDTGYIRFCNYKLSSEYAELKRIKNTIFPPVLNNGQASIVKIIPGKDTKKYIALKDQTLRLNEAEWKIMDSLYKLGKISEKYKNVYGALINAQCINNIILCYEATKNDSLLKIIDKEKIHLFNSVFLDYDAGSYKQMINNFIYSVVENNRFVKYGKNGITIDYRHAFDNADKYFSYPLLSYVQFICIKNIKEQYTDEDFQKFLTKYSQRYNNDTAFIDYFKSHFITTNSLNEQVYTTEMDSYLLSDVLQNKFRNNILYVDLWASWCRPCREVMPASLKLQKQFINSRIKFIYISIDENIVSWKNASKIDFLYSNPYSFILANPKSSKFLKDIKLSSIPRYLLIDKEGNIINNNAPPPDSKELIILLNSLL